MENLLSEAKRYGSLALDSLITHAPSVIIGIVLLWIGMRLINKLLDFVEKFFSKRNIDRDLQPFLVSMLSAIMKLMLILMCADIIGIPTNNFVAILAAASFAIGMAMQGSLANFAAGVMILLFKPYAKGDLVHVDGVMGHVKEIQIFNTILTGLENKRYIVPNAAALGGTITNLSSEKFLRVDLNVNMPYSEDFDNVERIILNAIKSTPKVLAEPAPLVGIESYDSHYVILAVRPYTLTEDYWDVYFNVNRNVKKALSENGIKVAYTEGMELGEIGK